MIITLNTNLKKLTLWLFIVVFVGAAGCRKGTFDINGTNPNALAPSSVTPKYYLSSSLAATANVMYTGANGPFYGPDIINTWMGYWSASGGYTPSPIVVLYQLTSGVGTGNWDDAYLNIKNYNTIQQLSGSDSTYIDYEAISLIMQAFMYQRIVDLYNNAPYSTALNTNLTTTPTYDMGSDIYMKNLLHIDSAVDLINRGENAVITPPENPSTYDVMFGGDMDMWKKFANTLKLKMLMRLTQISTGPATIAAELAKVDPNDGYLTTDAQVNPGYSTASTTQENPLYLDIAFTNTGSPGTNEVYWRANSYAVSFYDNTNDPRVNYFYVPNAIGAIRGRQIGSTSGVEGNSNISAVYGPGIAKGPNQSALIIGAFESYFLQAEAAERGFTTDDPAALYQAAVEQSFIFLGAVYPSVPSVTDPSMDSIVYTPTQSADIYIAQANPIVNYATSTNKLKTLITQKWAACNALDPLESYSDWRRLGIPTDLPVSNYPGNQAPHIPYRLDYPTTETSYNAANVGQEGTIDIFNSKIFWQP